MCMLYGMADNGSDSQGKDTDVSAATQVQKSFLDAVKRGQLENVKLYHQQGAKLMAPDSNSWTPLHHAARLGRLEIVKYIADNIPKPALDLVDDEKLQTALHKAAWFGYRDICKILVEKGASISRTDYQYNTPYDKAVQGGDVELQKFFKQQEVRDELKTKNATLQQERDEFKADVVQLQDACTQLKEELAMYNKQVADRENEYSIEIEEIQTQKQSIIEQKDNQLQQKDDQILELETQLKVLNDDVKEVITKTHSLQVNDASWNIQRGEVRINEEIGRGASGLVSKGTFHGQTVAVKQIHKFILAQKHVMDEFKREVRIMASVQHPNLVRFIGAVFDESVENLSATPLLILELLQSNLRQAYEQNDLSIGVSLSVFRDVAYGLHYLHEHQVPIIHRDVSAPNILLEALPGGMWRAKLSDFGSANFLKNSSTLGVGAIVYTAPEMFPREDPTAPVPPPTTKCDVFSFGIVLVEVLSKTMPSLKNRHQLFEQVKEKWRMMYDLIIHCTKPLPSKRPTMLSVLNTLNQIPVAKPRNTFNQTPVAKPRKR